MVVGVVMAAAVAAAVVTPPAMGQAPVSLTAPHIHQERAMLQRIPTAVTRHPLEAVHMFLQEIIHLTLHMELVIPSLISTVALHLLSSAAVA